MIKYVCKKCNINMETSVCPVCGERSDLLSSTVYWCEGCNIPLYEETCPICGKKAHRIASDLRPVFPEERLLLELMIGEPFKYKNASVWNATGNYYYADGKKIKFSVKQTKDLNADSIRKQLQELAAEVRKDIFVVCGTNGKTTTNNMLCAALAEDGNKVICNHTGSNMLNGVVAAFALSVGMNGNIDAAYACLVVAEESTRHIFTKTKQN